MRAKLNLMKMDLVKITLEEEQRIITQSFGFGWAVKRADEVGDAKGTYISKHMLFQKICGSNVCGKVRTKNIFGKDIV